jgi:predicted transcriptional regulator
VYVVMNTERVAELREEKGLSKRGLAGVAPRGFSEHDIGVLWPELLEAQSRQ